VSVKADDCFLLPYFIPFQHHQPMRMATDIGMDSDWEDEFVISDNTSCMISTLLDSYVPRGSPLTLDRRS
jgi:hypothetical protein